MLDNKKVVAFICECNPFHAGHKRLISAAKKEADIVIAIMSGNFVQRGEPAVNDKYERSKKLLNNGVSMVIELPVEYSLSSAKYFASSSIKILDKLTFVDKLIFGSKINDVNKLSKLADINIKSKNNSKVKEMIKSGATYSAALSTLYGKTLSPNDILAVEYIAAIKEIKSKITPISIKRINDIPTASELRKRLNKKITNDSFSQVLNYKILLAKNDLLNLENIYLMTSDFHNAITKLPNRYLSFEKIAKLLKTKNRTLANIKRVLLNIILGIDKEDVTNLKSLPKYIRILGVKKNFLPYMQNIKVPYLLSFAPSSYKTLIKNFPKSREVAQNKNGSFTLSKSISKNIFASNLYNYYYNNKKLESTTPSFFI